MVLERLSKREMEIVELLARGFTNEQISGCLHIACSTVKTHIRNIYVKTDIHDRANLAIHFLKSK